tara:strand:- start:85 stop:369 length:285 start_codon:yes stop_codon:yes gene_type:complete
MKNLLAKCKHIATSFGISKNNNWYFILRNQQATNDDLLEIQSIASENGLVCKFFARETSFDTTTGKQSTDDAHFVIMPPKETSDDEMLGAFGSN